MNYSGVTMRSKLEARWAIIFDLLGINWDYEPCHYEVGPGLGYLPDFYLPDLQIWAEVKGHPFLDAESIAKIAASVGGSNPIPIRNAPYSPATQLLLLGAIATTVTGTPTHSVVEPAADRTGYAQVRRGALTAAGLVVRGKSWELLDSSGVKKVRRPSKQLTAKLLDPATDGTTPDPVIYHAYSFAAHAQFDEYSGKLSALNDPDTMRKLDRRRAGRPLPAKKPWVTPR